MICSLMTAFIISIRFAYPHPKFQTFPHIVKLGLVHITGRNSSSRLPPIGCCFLCSRIQMPFHSNMLLARFQTYVLLFLTYLFAAYRLAKTVSVVLAYGSKQSRLFCFYNSIDKVLVFCSRCPSCHSCLGVDVLATPEVLVLLPYSFTEACLQF